MKKLYLFLTLMLSVALAGAAAPANDSFANRQTISTGLTTTNIADATVEAGEASAAGHTAWFTYTATADSTITLDTTGSAFYYPFVSVYIGTALNNLIYIAGDSGYYESLAFSFKVKAGTTYQIRAGNTRSSLEGASTLLKLTMFTTPFAHVGTLYTNEPSLDGYVKNDRFDNRTATTGSSLTVVNYLEDSTTEAGEPYTNVGRTIWYSYTAASDSVITIDTTGTNFYYNFVSVYMGNSINNLIEIDDDSSYFTPFTLSFKAKAGTTYQICAGSSRSDESGLLQFTLTTTPFTYVGTLYGPAVPTAPTPRNDSFYTPQALSGNLLTVIGSNASATIEAGESGITKSLHYTWTSSTDKYVQVSFPGNFSDGTFGVFTGSSPQNVVQVMPIAGSPATTYAFNAKAGVVYRMIVASAGSGYGQFQFSLTAGAPPVNHAPTSKITSPKKGQTVSTKGFPVDGYINDDDGVSQFQLRINGKTVATKPYPNPGKLNSGKVKKGTVTVEIRGKDTLGKWGPYAKVIVKAK